MVDGAGRTRLMAEVRGGAGDVGVAGSLHPTPKAQRQGERAVGRQRQNDSGGPRSDGVLSAAP